MKSYSAEVIEAIKNEMPRTEVLEFQLAGATVRLTTAGHDIIFNGNTYLADGLVVGVGSVKNEQELKIDTIEIYLSIVDQSMLALFQLQNQLGRRVVLTHLVLDDKHQVVGPLLSTTLRIDSYSVDDDEKEAGMVVTLSNYLARFDAVRGFRTTQASHQARYQGSTSFINSKDAGADLKWGGK